MNYTICEIEAFSVIGQEVELTNSTYRQTCIAMPLEKAYTIIREESGTNFASSVEEALLAVVAGSMI